MRDAALTTVAVLCTARCRLQDAHIARWLCIGLDDACAQVCACAHSCQRVQVRVSASHAVRAYMTHHVDDAPLMQLAPAMCLNRYDPLDSLRVCSQVGCYMPGFIHVPV
jgi:hypothetical protein